MSLIDIWKISSAQLEDKHIQQIIGFAGIGKLQDHEDTSHEFREFLSYIPSELLAKYAHECLTSKFDGHGFVLQDIVNQVGQRLGFDVEYGRYRGSTKTTGNDGLWKTQGGRAIIVEVKTSAVYQIDLEVLAGYQHALEANNEIQRGKSSILIVVGQDETRHLEDQIRGSKYAWDIRLITVDALLRLMSLKEDIEDPQIVQRICEILSPQLTVRPI